MFYTYVVAVVLCDIQSPYFRPPKQSHSSIRCNINPVSCKTSAISNSRNYKGNGYKPLAQRFLGFSGWTSLTDDWFLVALNTIDQSQLMLVHLNEPRNRCAESCTHTPYSFCSGDNAISELALASVSKRG